ncbi:MAG TPA: zinc ribbon domain-containing protein [Candidatus Sulfotelmatobacter sp.]|nr:zinc ribbon domain-containing protein [Candidatus Sulfotelmatobacter sp.]
MAFCNSCGTTLNPGAKFCNKCGATIAAAPSVSAAAPAAAPPAAAAPAGGSALKVVLIVVAVVVAIGILGLGTLAFVGWHFAKNAHISQQGDRVKVETPLGTFSANDTDQALKDLGVEVYPGAEVQKKGTATATFGPVRTVAANFQTSDPLDKVCDFYKSKYPGATVSTSEQNHCSIVSAGQNGSITINVEADGGVTKISIANVSKSAASGSSN